MKILITNPHLTGGGAERVVRLLARTLSYMGHQVFIAASSQTCGQDFDRYLSDVTGLRLIQHYIGKFIGLNFSISSLVDNLDLINAHNFPSYWAATMANTSSPVIWTCHEVLKPYYSRDIFSSNKFLYLPQKIMYSIDSVVVSRIDIIIANSLQTARNIRSRYKRESIVIYPPIDYDFFKTPPARIDNGMFDEADLVLLQIGRLSKLKNQISSIQALKLLTKKFKNPLLVLVGNGPERNKLEFEAERLQVKRNLKILPEVSDDELKKLYYRCDIYLNPSIEQSFGLAPFEAITCGKPVIVSNKCGAVEIIQKVASDFITDPYPTQISQAIMKLIKMDEKIFNYIESLHEIIREMLTPRIYVQKFLEVAKEMITVSEP